MIRVGIIDSGVHATHPHVAPVAGGIGITAGGLDGDYIDRLGHGTAVAGAIREKNPDIEIYAVKVFATALATTGAILLRALDWCLTERMDFINLSLGTTNGDYVPEWTKRLDQAARKGTTIVSALEMNGCPAYPGSLPQVVGVQIAKDCPRHRCQEVISRTGQLIYGASPYPRSIPGVPVHKNLQGISFAVANVTGILAAQAQIALCKEP